MRAVVLRGAGFIGSWIARELSRANVNVTIFGHQTPSALKETDHVRVLVGDFSDREAVQSAVKSADVVFHAGAYYPFSQWMKDDRLKRRLRT